MYKFKPSDFNITFTAKLSLIKNIANYFKSDGMFLLIALLTALSVCAYATYYFNGLGLAYNDARSHLDIGRRVVEGLKPGLAQLGSVWLPLPHILMIPTIWNDFMWHSGLSGALVSMISFVTVGVLIYKFLQKLGAGVLGRLVGVFIFITNINVLYLQSTAMTELLLLSTMTAGVYFLLLWHMNNKITNLISSAFFIMLSSLVRYDGWFLFLFAGALIVIQVLRSPFYGTSKSLIISKYKAAEGVFIMFATLGAFGIFLWFLWNLLIFKDPLYFAFGPYSAHAQQAQLSEAGNLSTKGNILLSIKFYIYALFYNNNAFISLLGVIGMLAIWLDKKLSQSVKIATSALLAPLIFNILALFSGFSVLFIQGISGNTWFNIRYGIMLAPSIAIFVGFLADRLISLRATIIGLIMFVTIFNFLSYDAVTIDDARVGSSQKNVSEVSGWLNNNTKDEDGFILISAASHDAIIFSSGLPMSKFIHEGTGKYWESATTNPEHWARWIIMRSFDDNDATWKTVSRTPDFYHYDLVQKYPFADIYQLKPEYLGTLNTKPVFGKQK